ncbi:MAG: TlpA disulfide reductase family protein [Deinococcales bacterium]
MNDVSLGPVVLSGPRFGVALALIALLVTAEILDRRGRKGVAPVVWNAVVLGLLAARLGYVALHLGTFARDPLSALYVWQGGFNLIVGVVAAVAYAAVALRARAALLTGALLAGLVGAVVWGGWQLASGPPPAPSPNVLTATLQALDGSTTDVKAFVGKPLVVNLWATWCAPCQRELPMLAAAASATPDVTFVFVSQGEPQARVASYLKAHDLSLHHVYLDGGSRLSAAVSTKGLPTTLFFDRRGHLVSRWLGELSKARLNDELKGIR